MFSTTHLIDLALAQLWQVTLVVAFIGLVHRLLADRAPRLMSLLWSVVAIKAVTPPLLESPLGIFSWVQAAGARPIPGDSSITVLSVSPSEGWLHALMLALLVIWLSGTCVLAVTFAVKLAQLERSFRRDAIAPDHDLNTRVRELAEQHNLPKPRRVVVSEDDLGPAVAGILNPTLIIPRSLVATGEESALEPVILHELVHTARRDAGHALLMASVRIVWWFHPAVWWAARQADTLVERCVDLTVTRDLQTGLTSYARGLLRVLELRARLQETPALSGLRPCQITTERLEYLRSADPQRRGRGFGRWARATFVAAFAIVVLPGLPLGVLAPTCDPAPCLTTAPVETVAQR
ncbi:MAG: M56 family metallopeptidase [Planctomycetota bacterium]